MAYSCDTLFSALCWIYGDTWPFLLPLKDIPIFHPSSPWGKKGHSAVGHSVGGSHVCWQQVGDLVHHLTFCAEQYLDNLY